MRKQYHLRKSENGFDAWDVDRLIDASKTFQIFEKPIKEITEVDENFWYQSQDSIPTCKSIIEHYRLIEGCSLDFPVILDYKGKLMDGMHRVAKALLQNKNTIKAVQFKVFLEPDYKNIQEYELSYERD